MKTTNNLAPVVLKLDNAIQWISARESSCAIQWIVIYVVDSLICLLNIWGPGQMQSTKFNKCLMHKQGAILLLSH